MRKENCPGREICEESLQQIKHAFSMDQIILTGAKSMKDGWNAFRENESNLAEVGINVKKGNDGRCKTCPIALFVEAEIGKTVSRYQKPPRRFH